MNFQQMLLRQFRCSICLSSIHTSAYTFLYSCAHAVCQSCLVNLAGLGRFRCLLCDKSIFDELHQCVKVISLTQAQLLYYCSSIENANKWCSCGVQLTLKSTKVQFDDEQIGYFADGEFHEHPRISAIRINYRRIKMILNICKECWNKSQN